MGESRLIVEQLLDLCLQRIRMEDATASSERELVQVLKNFEVVRRSWLVSELELKKYKELLVKSDVAKAALEVKLKHTRNQLDLEMKKRYKVEGDYQYLQRQMQLMCDILVHDSKSSACLNEEQKSLLATFEHKGGNVTLQRSSRRLCVIDESSFLSHSDISYDRTDDDVDVDASVVKPLKSRVREKRRSSMGPVAGGAAGRRGRGGNMSAELLDRKTVEKEVETIVKASVLGPEAGGPVHRVPGPEAGGPVHRVPGPEAGGPVDRVPGPEAGGPVHRVPGPDWSAVSGQGDQTSLWLPWDDSEMEPQSAATRTQRTPKHVFLSKTVIRPETCSQCGKRIRFGKVAVKCRNCRTVSHPECKQKLGDGCSGSTTSAGSAPPNSLEGFAPALHPRVPQLIVDCVTEIERRGLEERGLYRVPGGERLVKELRERFIHGKTPLTLSKVHDVHVLCGLLKDFLRKLKEPLLTFRLHRTFMEASELADEDGAAVLYQAVAELPKPNRDTLAFLMLHLHRVMRSPRCQMDRQNLSRVFGPTIVGHGMPEPSPTTIMRDTNTQPKVICRMLSIPEAYWRRVLSTQTPTSTSTSSSQEDGQGRLFKPLTSPELNSYYKSPSIGSLRGRIRNQGNTHTNIRAEPGRRFFTSPS